MAVYWLTFRIEQIGDDGGRRQALYDAIRGIASKWWLEPTSFILFRSDSDINAVAQVVESVIATDVDIVLIGMPDFKSARIIGAWTDADLTDLLPFVEGV